MVTRLVFPGCCVWLSLPILTWWHAFHSAVGSLVGKAACFRSWCFLKRTHSFTRLVTDSYLCRPTGLSWESDLLCVRWCQRGRPAIQPGRFGGSCHAATQRVACGSGGCGCSCSKQGSSHTQKNTQQKNQCTSFLFHLTCLILFYFTGAKDQLRHLVYHF